MISCKVICLDPLHGEFGAGYERPSAPGQFVPLVAGIYTQDAAQREADRLNDEARARQGGAFIEHSARGTARGWYTEEMP
jgi:hypothetical protein